MAWSIAPASSPLHFAPSRSISSPSALLSSSLHSHLRNSGLRDPSHAQYPRLSSMPERTGLFQSHAFPRRKQQQQQQQQEEDEDDEPISGYQFPDPIPEFAEFELERFRTHLLKVFSKKEDVYGDKVEEVLEICTEIFGTFLHTEYGGPGTLLVTPFMDIADTINRQGLPGGSKAARSAVKWAQKHVDEDWNEWTSEEDD